MIKNDSCLMCMVHDEGRTIKSHDTPARHRQRAHVERKRHQDERPTVHDEAVREERGDGRHRPSHAGARGKYMLYLVIVPNSCTREARCDELNRRCMSCLDYARLRATVIILPIHRVNRR